MKIQLNGEPRELPDGFTAEQLVNDMGLNGRRLAMEVNREIVPRSEYAEHVLHDGDQVEIVHAIGGG